MVCPKCNSENVQVISEVETTTNTKGFGCCKGFIGYLIFGPIGWLCGLCGMGKSRTSSASRTFWVCNSCGNKFR